MSHDPLTLTEPHPSLVYDNEHALEYWRFTFAGQFAAALSQERTVTSLSSGAAETRLTLVAHEIVATAVSLADELITELRCRA